MADYVVSMVTIPSLCMNISSRPWVFACPLPHLRLVFLTIGWWLLRNSIRRVGRTWRPICTGLNIWRETPLSSCSFNSFASKGVLFPTKRMGLGPLGADDTGFEDFPDIPPIAEWFFMVTSIHPLACATTCGAESGVEGKCGPMFSYCWLMKYFLLENDTYVSYPKFFICISIVWSFYLTMHSIKHKTFFRV